MKIKVAKWGNSLAVRLPKVVAQDLGLAPGREVDLVQDGTRLTLETARQPKIPVYRLQDLLAQILPSQKPPPFEDWSAAETPWPDEDWSDIAPRGEEWGAMKRIAQEKLKAGRKKGGKRSRRA